MTQSPDTPRPGRRSEILVWILPLAIGLLTLLTFAPALRNGFVNWDDDRNIVNNHGYRGFDGDRLRWMFTTRFGGHYQPLTWLSFAADHAIWGLNPFGFHLTNVLLHAVAAALFFWIALQVLRWVLDEAQTKTPTTLMWCAALAAAVFAVHPLRVESVAWATERRDVLSGVLIFATVLAYFRMIRTGGSIAWLAVSVALFGASLLAKAAAMTLPLVLLVMDVYPARRMTQDGATWPRLVAEKAPFFVLAILAAGVAAAAQHSAGAMKSLAAFGLGERIIVACHGVVFYLVKFLLPAQLSPLYPLPGRDALFGVGFLVGIVVVILLTIAAIRFRRRFPSLLAAWICYLVLLAPVSGIVQSGKHLAADRYTYLSLLPLALLIAGGLLRLYTRCADRPESKRTFTTFAVLASLYVPGLVGLSLYQTTVWANSVSLWSHAIGIDPTNSIAYVNLGYALSEDGAHDRAESAFAVAVQLDERDPRAFNGWGLSLIEVNEPAQALAALEIAVRLDPDNPRYHVNFGYVLAGFERYQEAAAHFAAAIQLAPGLIIAYEHLAAMQSRLGRYDDSRATLEAGLNRDPTHAVLRANLAWMLATSPADTVRDGTRAVELAEQLCAEQGWSNPYALDTLAAALAERGDFEQAIGYANSALMLAQEAKDTRRAEAVTRRIEGYRNAKPYRDE